MNARNIVASLRRRWYLSIAGLILIAGLCLAAFVIVPQTYEAKANVVLLPPQSSVDQGGNPYLQLSGLRQVEDVLIRALNSQASVESLMKEQPDATFEATPDFTTNAPILVVTVGNETPQATLQAMTTILATIPPTLANLQAQLGIEQRAQITSSVLDSDQTPSVVRKAQIRALIVAIAVGLLGSLFSILLVDSWIVSRRRVTTNYKYDASEAHSIAPQRQALDQTERSSAPIEISAADGVPTVNRRRRRQGSASGPSPKKGYSSAPPEHDATGKHSR